MTREELIEDTALKFAIANNGGNWAEHYNEDQKNVWRERAKALIDVIERVLKNSK